MLFFPTTEEDAAYFRSQGYTGSINDMHFKALGDSGYTGSLNDRIRACLTFKYGSYYEAMKDLRNGTSVFALSSYIINGFDPALVFDFKGNYFRKGSSASTFPASITHAATTNATMVDSDGLLKWRPHNLQVHSGDFSNSAWGKSALTVDTSYVAPDGTSTASKVTSNGSAGATGLYDSNPKGTGMSLTCFMKAGSSGVYGWIEGIVGGTSPYGVFDLESGTVVRSRECDASIESVGNGWFRCVLANTTNAISFFSAGGSDNTYSSSPWGSSNLTQDKFIYAWGAQMEAGAFPTSYIPTTGAAATRARDIAEIPTSTFGYNNDAGTVVCEFDSASISGSTVFTLDGAGSSHGITAIVYPAGRISYQAVTGGVTQVNFNFDAYATANQVSKVATVYAKDDFAAVLNGGAVATDTAGSVPPVSTLKLGVYWGAGDFFMSGHIKSIQYYPRRLTDTQLQELTT